MKTTQEKFLELLKENGQSLTWWVKKYIVYGNYDSVYKELEGKTNLKDITKKAMRKYLREWRK